MIPNDDANRIYCGETVRVVGHLELVGPCYKDGQFDVGTSDDKQVVPLGTEVTTSRGAVDLRGGDSTFAAFVEGGKFYKDGRHYVRLPDGAVYRLPDRPAGPYGSYIQLPEWAAKVKRNKS